ncbi:BrnT family toxin [Methylobacterium indicum]|uniref:BrnT family toxin n=1 Tax=Methylobacterium indicum TaxID=1775910 RepID=UPI002434B0FF|nr:BrnT family toxin [Methylobacterium indicum]
MTITFDPPKRDRALSERGLDFLSAEAVFAGLHHTWPYARCDDGETRNITIGHLDRRMVMIGWTPRDENRHVFTMRKWNEREQARYAHLFP